MGSCGAIKGDKKELAGHLACHCYSKILTLLLPRLIRQAFQVSFTDNVYKLFRLEGFLYWNPNEGCQGNRGLSISSEGKI